MEKLTVVQKFKQSRDSHIRIAYGGTSTTEEGDGKIAGKEIPHLLEDNIQHH